MQMKRLTSNKKNHKNVLIVFIMFAFIVFSCGDNVEKKETIAKETITTNDQPKVSNEPVKKLTAGERTFILCAACHNLKEGEPNKVGPNLHGIFGRKAGTYEGFAYSEALKSSDIVWNETHLRNWLEKPSDYIPGTTMAFIGITKKEQQDALIEYLKKETRK